MPVFFSNRPAVPATSRQTPQANPPGADRGRSSRAYLTFHTRAVSSPEAVTTRVPSGLNDALFTPSVTVCPESVVSSAPVAASQRRAVLSAEAVTTLLPSGLNAALLTTSTCPERVTRAAPVLASHSRAVLSFELFLDLSVRLYRPAAVTTLHA